MNVVETALQGLRLFDAAGKTIWGAP